MGRVRPIQITFETLPEEQKGGLSAKIKYNPYFCELLLKRLKRGDTVKEFCKELGISRSKFYRWLARHTEFFKAFERGREMGKEIWKLRCITPAYNKTTGKRYPNTSYHRLLAANIYGREFLPPKKKLSKEAKEMAQMKMLLLEST